jgi:N-acetyl-anhydromuramyl-L-alanine amidase AmpD
MTIDMSSVVVKDVSERTHPGLKEPRRMQPAGVVMHTTIGRNSLAWLQGGSYLNGTPASCDKLFAKDGTVYLLTGADEMSYHAGTSRWHGISDERGTLNRPFLGYEIENLDDGKDLFTPEQYLSVAASYAYDAARWRILDRNLVSHARAALPPGRKRDPLWFDEGRFWGLVWSIRNDWPPEWPVSLWVGR